MRVFRSLTEPDASVKNEDHRRNARWLMELMVLVLPLGSSVAVLDALLIPENQTPIQSALPLLLSSLFWLVPYAMSKRGHYQVAAMFLLLAAFVPIMGSVVAGIEHLYNLHYLLMPMLVASVVMSERPYWIISALLIAVVMTLPLVVDGLAFEIVGIESVAFLSIGLVLIWRVTAHRNDLEFARTSELRATNWALKHEIAERKKAEERGLQVAVEQERMRVFTAFIGTAAHDFMTPVSAIMTSLYLARRATDPKKHEHHLDQIQYQAERIHVLVDALLDMSRLESGSDLNFRMFNMCTLLTSTCERVRDEIEEKRLHLNIDCDKLTSEINASASELSCTFKKLLENAIQYTPVGGQIHLIGDEDEHNVIIEIRDNGEGIEPEVIPHIFDQFYRGDAARSTQTGGLGLGLTYVQRVVALHNGSIDVKSTPGNGTAVCVKLPKQDIPSIPATTLAGVSSS